MVAPRQWESVFLDLQWFGYTCAHAEHVLATLSSSQRERMLSGFYRFHDVLYPLSLFLNYGFLIYLANGSKLTWLMALPAFHAFSDLSENEIVPFCYPKLSFYQTLKAFYEQIVRMMHLYDFQLTNNLPIDLSPYCLIAGVYATPMKVLSYVAMALALLYLIVVKRFLPQKVKKT